MLNNPLCKLRKLTDLCTCLSNPLYDDQRKSHTEQLIKSLKDEENIMHSVHKNAKNAVMAVHMLSI
jgi:hypothetical protein